MSPWVRQFFNICLVDSREARFPFTATACSLACSRVNMDAKIVQTERKTK